MSSRVMAKQQERKMTRSYLGKLVLGVLLSAALAACVVSAAGPGGEVVAYEAPPPVRYETVGVAPSPGYFWIGGGWFWEGNRYNWHPGRWEAPRPGYRWQPHAWHQKGNEWHMAPGHWEAVKR
jgi:WXXGXW repeat (2 copies)